MPKSQPRIVWYTFGVATLLLTSAMLYSFFTYTSLFSAVRTLKLSVNDFDFRILDSTRIEVKTTIALNNTSSHEFSLLGIQQRVYVNYTFVGLERAQGIDWNRPVRIPPQSSENTTITMSLDFAYLQPELVELLLELPGQKVWQVFVNVHMEVPIVGRFYMDAMKTVAT